MSAPLSFDFLKTELSDEHTVKIDSYLNSALYYLITGRKGAWLYKGHHSALVVCVHPHVEGRLLVFPEIGKADYELTASVLNMIDPPAGGVQLARYSEENVQALKQQLAKLNYTAVTGISIVEEDLLDWRYPIRVLDTEKVAAMDGADFKYIRRKFRKAAQSISHIPLNQKSALRMMKAALKFWEGNMIFNEKDTEDMSEFYLALFQIMEKYPDSIDGLFFMEGRKPLGFSVWDTPSEEAANFLVSLSDTSVVGLSDYQVVTACQTLSERGIKFLNKGGSELESLDAFKAKFQPAKTVKVVSADVVYRKPENTNIEVHTIVEPQNSL